MSHQLLVGELNRLYPEDDVRSEEGLEHVAGGGRLWIVDPLDGTREFRERGRSDWAVHVALAVGGAAAVGAVALPALDLVLSTADPPVLPPFPDGESPRVVVSRSRPPDVAYDVTERLGGVMMPMGSAGAKIAAVILGAADVYVHAGGQYEWDSCRAGGRRCCVRPPRQPARRGRPALRGPRRLAARSRGVPQGVRTRGARGHHAAAQALLVTPVHAGPRRPTPAHTGPRRPTPVHAGQRRPTPANAGPRRRRPSTRPRRDRTPPPWEAESCASDLHRWRQPTPAAPAR